MADLIKEIVLSVIELDTDHVIEARQEARTQLKYWHNREQVCNLIMAWKENLDDPTLVLASNPPLKFRGVFHRQKQP